MPGMSDWYADRSRRSSRSDAGVGLGEIRMEPERRDLIAVLEKLKKKHGRAPSYGQLWLAAANGKIPARRVGRTWDVDDADLPVVAEHFGLTASVPTSAA
jgi:hypothetical protein